MDITKHQDKPRWIQVILVVATDVCSHLSWKNKGRFWRFRVDSCSETASVRDKQLSS